MMKVGILSDSHGSLKWFKKAYSVVKECDLIIHAGDILYHGPRNSLPEDYNPAELASFINGIEEEKIIFVRGNCDADVDQTVIAHDISLRFKNFKFGKLKLGLLHGDQFSGINEAIKFAEKFGLNILIFGHTHRKFLQLEKGHLLINPGSISLPKDNTKSLALLSLGDYNVKIRFVDLENEITIEEKKFSLMEYIF